MDSEKSNHATKIPDFYALLKIAPKQPDSKVIRQALKRLADRLERLEDQRIAQQAKKLMMLAQQTLLDDQRKAAYDGLWEKVYGARVAAIPGASNVPPPISHSGSDSLQLEAILPAGDPMAPLDLASYLKSAQPANMERSRSDFDHLMKLLTEQLPTDSHTPLKPAEAPLAADLSIAISSSPSVTSNSKPLKHSNSRRRRDRPYLLTLLGSVLTLVCILVVLVVMLNRNRLPSTLIEPQSTRFSPESIQKKDSGEASSTALRSGLPAVKGLGPDELQPRASASDRSEVNAQPELSMTDAQADSEIELSAEQKNLWRDSMTELREVLRAGEMNRAEELATQAKTVAITRGQQTQVFCIVKIMSLLQSYQQAIQDAASSLDAGQTFMVGSQEVAVVQADPQQIVIRVAGKNQTYQINRLPLRLSLALVELSLPVDDPQALAMRAVHVAISVTPPEDLLENAKQWMQTAIEASAVPVEIMAFFEDDFRLE